jgi:hypothetical protein
MDPLSSPDRSSLVGTTPTDVGPAIAQPLRSPLEPLGDLNRVTVRVLDPCDQ